MEWTKFIVIDPKIALGKPTIRGTRLTPDFVLELLGKGWTEEQVCENYPQLNPEILSAVFSFAAARIRDEEFFYLNDGTAS